MASTSSQAPSSSASYSISTDWDVFLSFHGDDSRYKFTSHLYAALDRHGVRTYKDDPELHGGEVISDALFQAIQGSKTYITVLSENYAFSPWCLEELVEILNCHKTRQRLIIPVFYNIDPSVVRHQLGSFSKAFEKHQIRFAGAMEKVNKWRLALTEIAQFAGKHIHAKRSEADIVDEIIDEILLKINPKISDLGKYPVGLNSRVRDITLLLNSHTEGMIKFGIYGMGGVGKTTFAKALYKELFPGSFKGSCFLEDVSEVAGRINGLVSLQQRLINDVLKSKKILKVDSVNHGISSIGARICSNKILVVIDDLDHVTQFQSLVGPFASGSVVIITTRDEQILDTIEVEPRYRYMVQELDAADSMALFTRHAFGNSTPNNTLMELSNDILQHAGGLPLALKVFGANLFNQSEEGWRWFIDKIRRLPNSDVERKLVISFDALKMVDPTLQDIFLDIACFFCGRKKEVAVKILEGCYTFINHKIDILKKRCLLTINDSDELGMHDLLLDMGRKISRNNSPDEHGKHSRLWESKDILGVLKNCKVTEAIEVMMDLNFYKEESLEGVSVTTETFRRMWKLRILLLATVNITGSFERTFENLRVLSWYRCPLKFLPYEFFPQKLVSLDLPNSQLRTMWEPNMVPRVFVNLKSLWMGSSLHLTTMPDFTKLPCLEELDLRGCIRLEDVHTTIGSLVRLVSLNLENCANLTSLGESICNLRALKILNIGGCSSLRALPTKLGDLESLTKLVASGLTVLTLPYSMARLSKLVQLELNLNRKLKNLPDPIGNLRSLEILNISECEKLEILPDQLWKITRLRELHAGRARMLKTLPCINSGQVILSLKNLDLSKSSLTTLPSGICQLSNLETLNLCKCLHLLYIAELPLNLKCVSAEGCKTLQFLTNLSNLKRLEFLDLTDCIRLKEIQGLKGLSSIQEILLGGCHSALLAQTFTEDLFQIYSGFGHQIKIYAKPEEFPDWICQLPDWFIQSSDLGSKVSLDLLPNWSDNFLAMILCLDKWMNFLDYSVTTTTSNNEWTEDLRTHYYHSLSKWSEHIDGSLMVIVPRSILLVRDGDDSIEVSSNVKLLGIHLLYGSEIATSSMAPLSG
ncbi:hypothetical protein ACET3Z_004158 [Daucus carota]